MLCRSLGTTAICVMYTDGSLIVANCGDSRAILATKFDQGLKAKALSLDQTPFRKDERERVRKWGARVMTMGQVLLQHKFSEAFHASLFSLFSLPAFFSLLSVCVCLYSWMESRHCTMTGIWC